MRLCEVFESALGWWGVVVGENGAKAIPMKVTLKNSASYGTLHFWPLHTAQKETPQATSCLRGQT
jgi:hypothetical protein